jgi:uncharacterized protein
MYRSVSPDTLPASNRKNFSDTYSRIFDGKRLKSVTFIVTHECNLRCTYCYEHNKGGSSKLSLETAKRCIDTLYESDAQNGVWINPDDCDGIIMDFIGGEPLLEIDLIDQTMDYFLEQAVKRKHRWGLRYMINMSSNGMLWNTDRVREFARKWEGRLSVSITVDGDKETHDSCRKDLNGNGSYDLASEAFQELSRVYGRRNTKLTIAPGNVDRVFTSHRHMMEEFDVRILNSNCVYEEGWNYDHAKILYGQLKILADWLLESGKHSIVYLSIFDDMIGKPLPQSETQNWCGGTGLMLAFDTDGSILPCARYSKMSLSVGCEPIVVGHVDTGIASTEEQLSIVRELESITRQSQSTQECIDCPIASGCAWCSAYNYEVYGTPNKRATFICPMHKARVMAASYYHNKKYRQLKMKDRMELSIPKDWALEIISEEEYEMLIDISR